MRRGRGEAEWEVEEGWRVGGVGAGFVLFQGVSSGRQGEREGRTWKEERRRRRSAPL